MYDEVIQNLSIQDFKSSLSSRLPSQEQVDEFNKEHKGKTMKQVTLEYMKNDIDILQTVFTNFVEKMTATYGLNPLHCYSLPGYTWNVFLSKLGIPLELITDEDMLKLFLKGKRGGISGVMGKRYIKSGSKKILYIDANNLYGWAMCQKLPYKDFTWSDDSLEMILSTSDDAEEGYFIECDLDYPLEVKHETFNLPLGPEKKKINKDVKLILDHNDKTNYICHYRLLKFYVEMGLKVTKIHKVIKFKQDNIMKDYIELNTNLRTNSDNDFEKDLYKLMNNALFGKTCENLENRRNFKIIEN